MSRCAVVASSSYCPALLSTHLPNVPIGRLGDSDVCICSCVVPSSDALGENCVRVRIRPNSFDTSSSSSNPVRAVGGFKTGRKHDEIYEHNKVNKKEWIAMSTILTGGPDLHPG